MDKYYQFSTTDMRLLTRVLSFGPTPSIPSSSAQVKNYKEATRQLIDMLPSYLRSKHNWFSSTNFCSTHKQLNPCEAALEHLFEDFKHELSTKLFETWIPLQLKGLLSPMQCSLLMKMEDLNAIWLAPEAFAATFCRKPDPEWELQTNGCTACMLSRIGGDFQAVGFLGALLLGGMKRDMDSMRVTWCEGWLKGAMASKGKEDEEILQMVFDRMHEMGDELREVRQRDKRVRQGKGRALRRGNEGRSPQKRSQAEIVDAMFELKGEDEAEKSPLPQSAPGARQRVEHWLHQTPEIFQENVSRETVFYDNYVTPSAAADIREWNRQLSSSVDKIADDEASTPLYSPSLPTPESPPSSTEKSAFDHPMHPKRALLNSPHDSLVPTGLNPNTQIPPPRPLRSPVSSAAASLVEATPTPPPPTQTLTALFDSVLDDYFGVHNPYMSSSSPNSPNCSSVISDLTRRTLARPEPLHIIHNNCNFGPQRSHKGDRIGGLWKRRATAAANGELNAFFPFNVSMTSFPESDRLSMFLPAPFNVTEKGSGRSSSVCSHDSAVKAGAESTDEWETVGEDNADEVEQVTQRAYGSRKRGN